MRRANGKMGLVALALPVFGLGLAVLSGCRLAPTAESSARQEAGLDRQLTSDANRQRAPVVSGDRVVWEERRDGQLDLFLLDLDAGEQRRLTDDPADQTSPAISGDRVVWEDHRNAGRDIYVLDLADGTERRLTEDASVQVDPDLSGGRVVWRDNRNGGWGVVLHDLVTGEETWLTTGTSSQSPAISDGTVVWIEGGRIRGQDLTTGEDLAVPGEYSVVARGGLALDGSRVAWTDDRDSENLDVYTYDFEAGTTTRLTTGFEPNWLADVGGGYVATIDERGRANRPLFLRPIPAGEVLQANPWDVSPVDAAHIDGRRVVYTGFREGAWNLHLYELK